MRIETQIWPSVRVPPKIYERGRTEVLADGTL